jgi:hypothetical protein
MPNTFSKIEDIQESIRNRWEIIDWDQRFRWWRPPARVRILMYADGSARFQGGPFLGLQYVATLLKSRAYSYVDFQIDTAHRDGTDPSASIPGSIKLTDLDIVKKYDEVWFFGVSRIPNLSLPEIARLNEFMAAPNFGGILVTGDHEDLGRGIAGQIPRAGEMRRYPAPPDLPPTWNTTLAEGSDANLTYDFDEQSDDRPQQIRYKRYRIGGSFGGHSRFFQRRYRPHPILCGPDGPIDVLPDHQHEGEAIAPRPRPNAEQWPTVSGHQEAPEVIAWGRIKDPAATKYGQEIGLVSAYNGHNVNVGRILADSTWHHWFDINLTGTSRSPYDGFDQTSAGREALKKIDAYFLNCGVWLAPPDKQAQMRNAGWWSVLWSDRMVELSPTASIDRLGEEAIDALGRRAPRCTVSEWVLDLPIFREKIPRWQWPQLYEKFLLIDLPFEQFIAGGILRQLMQELGPWNSKSYFPEKAPEDQVLEEIIFAGVEEGLASLSKKLSTESTLVSKLVDGNFRLESIDNR